MEMALKVSLMQNKRVTLNANIMQKQSIFVKKKHPRLEPILIFRHCLVAQKNAEFSLGQPFLRRGMDDRFRSKKERNGKWAR